VYTNFFGYVTEVEWSDWSECSVTCGTGKQSRYSRCVDDGSRLELCMEAGGEHTETRACNREACTASTSTTSTTTEVAGSGNTSQALPDMFFPPIMNHTSMPPLAERKHSDQHKHRKFHHKNMVYKSVAANSSLVNVSEWGVGKSHELVHSGEGEFCIKIVTKQTPRLSTLLRIQKMIYAIHTVQYVNQYMHSIKYNSRQVWNSYMFRHLGAILRDLFRTKEYKTMYQIYFWNLYGCFRGTLWRSLLRNCATSQKVAGSIHDGVTGIFYWHNPSGRTMALGLTQTLTEMSTRNISSGVNAAGA
jgi:hypothetical protein